MIYHGTIMARDDRATSGGLERKIDTFVKTSRRDKKLRETVAEGGGSKKSCFRMRVWKLRRSAAAWTACASFCVYVSIKDASSESLEGVLGGGSRIFYLYSTFVRKNNVYGWRGREEDSCSGWNRDETTVTRMMMMKGNRTSSIKHFVCS